MNFEGMVIGEARDQREGDLRERHHREREQRVHRNHARPLPQGRGPAERNGNAIGKHRDEEHEQVLSRKGLRGDHVPAVHGAAVRR